MYFFIIKNLFLTFILLLLIAIYFLIIAPLRKIRWYKATYGNQVQTYFYPVLGIYKLQFLQKQDSQGHYKKMIQDNPHLKALVSNLGPYVIILFMQPEGIKEININNSDKYVKYVPIFMYDSIDRSLLFTEKKKHRIQRKLFSNSFDFNSLRESVPLIRRIIGSKFSDLQQKFKICNETMNMSGDIGVNMFFGEDFGSKQFNGKPMSVELGWLVDKIISHSHASLWFSIKRLFIGSYSWKLGLLLSPVEKEMINRSKGIKELSLDTVKNRIERNKKQQSYLNKESCTFLDVMVNEYLRQQDQKKNNIPIDPLTELTLDEIHQQSLGMYIAGTDNTGIFMGMILYCLAKYKDEALKVKEEINQIFPQKDSQECDITLENIQKLNYTHAFIKEAFRHYSSSGGQFIRCAEQSHLIDGIKVDKNDMVIVSWYSSFYNPRFYPNPTQFNVDHFLKSDPNQNTYAWTPFSVGPRNCIGMQLSMLEIKIMVIYFVKMFEYEVNDKVKLKIVQGLTNHPANDELINLKSLY